MRWCSVLVMDVLHKNHDSTLWIKMVTRMLNEGVRA